MGTIIEALPQPAKSTEMHKSEDAKREGVTSPASSSTPEEHAAESHAGAPARNAHAPQADAESGDAATEKEPRVAAGARKKTLKKNNVRKIRTEKMMSKAELARRAGMSTLTIDRVERGMPCRMDTKRKILEALGLKPSDRVQVFGEDD